MSEPFETSIRWIEKLRAAFRKAEQKEVPPLPLDRYLKEAVANPNLVPNLPLPYTINLGKFGNELERLQGLSQSDLSHREFGSIVLLDHKGNLLLPKEPILGDEKGIVFPKYNNKRTVMTMHSHGVSDTPFSPASGLDFGDIGSVLISPTIKDAMPAELLVTDSIKMLILRTNQTPRNLDMIGVTQTGAQALQEVPEGPGEHVTNAVNNNSDYRMFWLTRIAQRFNLAIYSCPLTENIVKRAT